MDITRITSPYWTKCLAGGTPVKRLSVILVFLLALVIGLFAVYFHGSGGENGSNLPPTQNGSFLKCPSAAFSGQKFSLSWGTAFLENASEVRRVPFVKFSVDVYGRTNVSTGELTAKVPVVVLCARGIDGKPLWNLTFSGYAWAYDGGRYGVKENGTAVPGVLITNTGDYLYTLVYQTAPRPSSEFRNYAPDDYFYVLGKNGTVRKFDLGRGFLPLRNAFLVSNGSYVLVGFERPLPDGSPMSGYVMILNGTEVVWSRTFQMNDPSCLCYVIPGWGKIDQNGCATFGLYDGYATYCNGTLTFHQNSNG